MSNSSVRDAACEPGQAVAMELRGEDILIWLRNNKYTDETAISSIGIKTPPLENYVIRLKNVAEGEYTVKWYNPQIGWWLDEAIVQTSNKNLELSYLPSIVILLRKSKSMSKPPVCRTLAQRLIYKRFIFLRRKIKLKRTKPLRLFLSTLILFDSK